MEFIISDDMINSQGKLNLKSLCSMLESAANGQLKEGKLDMYGMLEKGVAWIIVRREAEIKRLPELGEKVFCETRGAMGRHGIYQRWYDITDGEGNMIITVACHWCILDIINREILFDSDITKGAPLISKDEWGKRIEMRVNFPELVNKKVLKVTSEYIDANGHMNNSYYLKWAESIQEEAGLKDREAKYFWIEYAKELLLGEEAEISWTRDGDDIYIAGTSKDEKSFSIKLGY